jgi:hypothetical protein
MLDRPRNGTLLRPAVALLVFAALGAVSAAAQAATGDIGFRDQSFTPLGGSPTGTKPESKLWFNAGSWWASMYVPSAGEHRIFNLNRSTEQWTDTGVAIDARDSTRADTLWDAAAGKLYVASHVYTTSSSSGTTSNNGRVWRYSYTAGTGRYRLDSGFPAGGLPINTDRTETLVIAKDSAGTLWATWTRGSRVYVNHTIGGNDTAWATPYILPAGNTTLTSDDISSIIAFGGDKIGVIWSNQADHRFYFAVHEDGRGDAAADWSAEAVPGTQNADDHVNLKTDSAGRIYAAVKHTSSGSSTPLVSLLVRAASGAWTSNTFGRVKDSHTRPIVEIDEEHQVVHMFATGPQPPGTSGQSGGDIVEKTSPMGAISFPTGVGTPVIRSAGSPDMNDATSTKQNVSSATGLVVMAGDGTTDDYWHADISLSGVTPPPPPPPPPPPGPTQTILPVADAQVKSTSANGNYGTLGTLRVRQGTSSTDATYHSYLTFTVSGLTQPPTSAKLRLYVTDASPDGGRVYPTDAGWTEPAITWNNAPPLVDPAFATIGATTLDTWAEIDLGSRVSGDGTYSFGLASSSTNSGLYSSREGTHPPELVLTTG